MEKNTQNNEPFWQAGLNEGQHKAVLQTDGPVLILAGAGSGKTKTLTHRIAYLITEKNITPSRILAVTFTNKAAGEMRERVGGLLEKGGFFMERPANIGTFHSICVRILRREIGVLGTYGTDFNILDDQDQQTIMKRVLKSLELSDEEVRPRAMSDAISRAKNALQSPDAYLLASSGYYEEMVAKVYAAYHKELVTANALDFDDLIMLTVRVFQEHPEVLARYQEFFQYILVDEYQDTNHPQYLLVTLLAAKHRNLFVIGDDYQSIYGWRQADITNILNFEKDYPEAVIITLDQNYRSTQNILDAAQGVIEKNSNQRKKTLWTAGSAGALVTRVAATDETAEAHFVAKTVLELQRQQDEAGSCAVLYRTNAQSRALEEMFLRSSVSYKIVGGLKFYQRKEIKDMVALVRFYVNPRDFLALERILGAMKVGIGKSTLDRWSEGARGASLSYAEVLLVPEHLVAAGLTQRKIIQLTNFVENFTALQHEMQGRTDVTLPLFLERLAEKTGYKKALDDGTPEGKERLENVRELFSVATKFAKEDLVTALEKFLEEVALSSDTDEIEETQSGVQVMTVHSAKGLEFDTVFIIGLEENIFPHSRSALSLSELEEERRLMYVALTRAKKKLYLISTDSRVIFGSVQSNPPSRFLTEIPEDLCEDTDHTYREAIGFARGSASTFGYGKQPAWQAKKKSKTFVKPTVITKTTATATPGKTLEAGDVRPGDMVEHPEFGGGLVVALSGSLITVAFKTRGVKKMMLGIAPLTKVE
jgi:DNA helicase-2/ATP-dependent DNA helicase PcrA